MSFDESSSGAIALREEDDDAGIPRMPQGGPLDEFHPASGAFQESASSASAGDGTHYSAQPWTAEPVEAPVQDHYGNSYGNPCGTYGGSDAGSHFNPSGGGAPQGECGMNQNLVQSLSEDEKTARKIFVGGISRATEDSLRDYFSQYGQIYEAEVLYDKVTGRSRGFGFVTFADTSVIDQVVDKHHTIDGCQVEVRRAIPREEARLNHAAREEIPNDGSGRVFIGGLGDEITDDVLRDHFGQFGELTSANVMIDRQTNRPRGFGFVIYKNPEDADKALGPQKELGPNCEAKRAQPRNQSRGVGMRMDGRYPGGVYRQGVMGGTYAGGRRDYDYSMGYAGQAGGMGAQAYGGYNYAYHPYYAAYYAQMAAAYGGAQGYSSAYAQSPVDPNAMASNGQADRGGRMTANRSTPY